MLHNSDKRIINSAIYFSGSASQSNGQIQALLEGLRPIIDSVRKTENNSIIRETIQNEKNHSRSLSPNG